ncbi:ABC transporter substrate-binding protein [Micromonospora echinofusca]|uniref:Extracellular solute-binding protein n=1 Tax=Micromonospora echinofusca TaxID=47858 RepID=A0ABS3VL11_MICEH|nr:ABC transporter substrate-binding protein [Micromonospora echinofusca]MBO4205192.1 extracellular solute-binding protein [Micromonospora echinofusca]
MKRRSYLAGVAGLAASLVLTACNNGGTEDPSEPLSGAGKTLVVQGSAYFLPVFKEVGAQLQQQLPGLQIRYDELTGEQESSTNLQVVTSDAAPDVADIPTNLPPYRTLLKAQQLIPLDDVWAANDLENGYGKGLANSLKADDGRPYVVSYSRTLYGVVWYNKAIFSKLNITVPADHQIASMADLLTITNALRAGGYQPLAAGGASNYHLTWILDSLLPTSATSEQLTNFVSNFNSKVPVTVDYTDPSFTAVLDRLKEMYDNKVFQDGTLGMDSPTTNALFASGKAGMLMGHDLSPTGAKKTSKTDLDLDFLFLPPINPGVKTLPVNYAGNTLAIPKKAKNPAIAKEFLKLLMSKENQAKAIKWSGGAAPAIDLPTSLLTEGKPANEMALLSYGAANGTRDGWASIVPAKLGTTDPYIEKLFTGKMTAAEIGKALNGIRDELRSSS